MQPYKQVDTDPIQEKTFHKNIQINPLHSTSQTPHLHDNHFSIFQALVNNPVRDSMPEYFVSASQSDLENIDAILSSTSTELLIRKSPDWSYQTPTGIYHPIHPDSIKQVIEWAMSNGRQRFEFEYTTKGWKPKLNANFDFENIDLETTKLITKYGMSELKTAVEGGFKAQSYIEFLFARNIEKALLSIIDGNIVLWQKSVDGQESVTMHSLKGSQSAFNLFKDYSHIRVQGDRLVIPLQAVAY